MPPYGDAIPPSLFAPYGEYADAFLLTADVRDDGRSGTAGAPAVAVEVVVDAGFVTALPVDIPVEDAKAEFAPVAPARSHGFGGDTVAIVSTSRTLFALEARFDRR